MEWIVRRLAGWSEREDSLAGNDMGRAALAGDAGTVDPFDRLAEAAARMQRPVVAVFRRNR